MSAAYLTAQDVMAILQCSRDYAYALIHRIGPAPLPGILRVSAARFYEYLEGKGRPCASTDDARATASGSGGHRGPTTGGPSGTRRGARRGQPPSSSSHAGSESVQIPFTPPRKTRRSA